MGEALADIPAWIFEQATPWSLVMLGVVLIGTGRLIPPFYYRELKEDRDRHRAANENLEEAVVELSKAVPEILEIGRTMKKIMDEIRRKAEEAGAADEARTR